MPEELIQKMKDFETFMEFEQNGDTINETLSIGPKVIKESYIVGEESEFKTWNDQTVKVVFLREQVVVRSWFKWNHVRVSREPVRAETGFEKTKIIRVCELE